jgi:hypothetical protein
MDFVSIDGFEGWYSISRQGVVRNDRTGKIQKQGLNNHGYWAVTLNGRRHSVHRLLSKAFLPNPDNKPQVNHKDGDTSNNALSNLEWCTQQENTQHAYATGLAKGRKGTQHHLTSLCETDVLDIRRLYYEDGLTTKVLSERYVLSQSAISLIVNNVTWTHIKHHYLSEIHTNRKRNGGYQPRKNKLQFVKP